MGIADGEPGPPARAVPALPGPGDPAQNTLWVLASTPVTGIATYVLLVVTARAVGPDAFGDFGVFWAATIISGLGVFLPLEQETTSRGAGRATASLTALWRRATTVAMVGAVACAGLAFAMWPLYGSVVDVGLGLVAAYAVSVLGNALQFPGRGVLAAMRRFRDYGVVVVVEAVLRAMAAVALAVAGQVSATAYALAVGLSALLSGLLAAGLAGRAIARPGIAGSAADRRRFGRDGLRLVVAASAMQTILNSATVVAKVLAPAGQPALAGRLTAMLTLARLPVLVVQSIQATYVSRLAARHHAHDSDAVRALLRVLAAAALIVALGLVAGAAALGPWAMSVVFGSGYTADRTTVVLVAAGVGVYMIASVATDASIALGRHAVILAAWLGGLAVAILTVVMAPTTVIAATVPLIAGAFVAAAVLAPSLIRRATAG